MSDKIRNAYLAAKRQAKVLPHAASHISELRFPSMQSWPPDSFSKIVFALAEESPQSIAELEQRTGMPAQTLREELQTSDELGRGIVLHTESDDALPAGDALGPSNFGRAYYFIGFKDGSSENQLMDLAVRRQAKIIRDLQAQEAEQ